METFLDLLLEMCEKIEYFQYFFSTWNNLKLGKNSLSFGSPYWYKKLENIIFQLSITGFSEQFKIVKKNFS